jgi:TolB-like protein/Tfp pilus assembly protein PilF
MASSSKPGVGQMSFFSELKRRNVFRVSAAYLVVSWLLLQVIDTLVPILSLSDAFGRGMFLVLVIGFPVVLIVSWVFELTPEGIQTQSEADESGYKTSSSKLNAVVISGLALALVFVVVDQYILEENPNQSFDVAVEPVTEQTVEQTTERNLRSIAALPFANESADEENAEFFANGMHDELLTYLTKINDLKVISRTSVMEYKDTIKNMRQIGDELGVATILEGRVQRAGNNVRINVQLIDTESDEHIWAEIYDRELTAENIFAIQSEMAFAIADALQATLSPAEVSLIEKVPTQNTLAYDFYLSGLDYFNRTEYEFAAQQFQRAVDSDPNLSLGWAMLSRSYSHTYWGSQQIVEQYRFQALEAVEKALMLDPELPEAHLAMGHYYYHGLRDYQQALEELAIARADMPGQIDAIEMQAFVNRRMGNWEEAADLANLVFELNPRAATTLSDLSLIFTWLKDYDKANIFLDKAIEILPDFGINYGRKAKNLLAQTGGLEAGFQVLASAPDDVGYLSAFTEFYIKSRNFEQAINYIENSQNIGLGLPVEINLVMKTVIKAYVHGIAGNSELAASLYNEAKPAFEQIIETIPNSSFLLSMYGVALAGINEKDAALDIAQQALRLMPESIDILERKNIQNLVTIGIFIPIGEYELAIDTLDNYLATPGGDPIESILLQPTIDHIRNEPGFIALVEKYQR